MVTRRARAQGRRDAGACALASRSARSTHLSARAQVSMRAHARMHECTSASAGWLAHAHAQAYMRAALEQPFV
eukprot:4836378-Pleurochrysis_carterae.AAC.3